MKRLLEIAVAIARQPGADVDAYWETHDRVDSYPGGKALLKQLTTTKIDQWRRDDYKRAAKRRCEHAKHKAGNIKRLKPLLGDLRVGRRPEHLDWTAQLYFWPPDGGGKHLAGVERIVHFTDLSTADAVLAGWEYLATVDLFGVNAAMLGTAEAEGRRYYVEWPAIAGLDRLFEEGRLPSPASMPISLAIAVIKSSFILNDQGSRKRLEQWATDRLNLDPILGASQLLDYFSASLDAGATQLTAIWRLSEDDTPGGAVAQAIDRLLATRPAMPPEALRSLLQVAGKHLNAARLQELTEAALADPAVVDGQRAIWTFVGFALDPVGNGERLIAEHSGSNMFELFDSLMGGFITAFHVAERGARAVVRLLGPATSPDDELSSGPVTREARLSGTVRQAITWLASHPHPDAGVALARLIEDRELAEWRPSLCHAQAQQARLQRDRNFKHRTPSVIRAALDGGPPVNAADLRAVVLEELTRLRAELRTNNTTPWKRYWNLDPHGKPTEPRVENECRDHLLERLQDRLSRYRIVAAVPEARRGEDTRVDMLMLTAAGRNLPVEAKRHSHRDIWTAASTQLQGYTAAEAADGRGIYLVFWFGNEASPTPARLDGGDGPRSARELEAMLVSDLAPDLRARTDVIVFDLSDPEAPATAAPRKKRSSKTLRAATAP